MSRPPKFWILGVFAGAVAAAVMPVGTESAAAGVPLTKKKAAPASKAKLHNKGSGPAAKPAVPGMTSDPVPSSTAQCKPGYTICDFIHPKITMAAQQSLAYLYAQGGTDCALALTMLGAADTGGIVGIHKEDEGKPALMARRHGTSWWELIADGEGAIVSELEKPPMVVFEKRLATKPVALAYEMREAWLASSLRSRTFTPPPPKNYGCAPPSPRIDDEPPEIIVPEACQCWPEFPPEMNVCGQSSSGDDLRCLPVAGKACGVCETADPRVKACLDRNDKTHSTERQKCKADYSPGKVAKYAVECAKHAVECQQSKAVKSIACIEAALCVADPKPLREFQGCLNRETDRYNAEAKRCRAQ